MWQFFADLRNVIATIFRLEYKMGTIAKAIEGMSAKLDKIEAEYDRAKQQAQEPDAEDRAALAAVQERLQRLDDKTPDTPADTPATPDSTADTPAQLQPEDHPVTPVQLPAQSTDEAAPVADPNP